MDFLLSILGIGGVVFAGVMLLLASRATRLQRESDARVDRLQAMAVGSVLFADDGLVESPAGAVELRDVRPQPAPALTFNMTTDAHPFVMTVPARSGRVSGSFNRRSQT